MKNDLYRNTQEKDHKKILVISNMYPSRRFPHYGVFVENTADILKENGFQVTCIGIQKQCSRVKRLWAYIKFHLRVLSQILLHRYDFIYAHYISHTALALLLAKRLRPDISIVVNVHGNDIVPEDKKDESYLPLVRRVCPKVKTWIAPSGYFKEILVEQYQVAPEKIVIYPSGGIDCGRFVRADASLTRKELGISETDFLIGYVGRIEKDKGWDTLVLALKELRSSIEHIKCIMVGTGDCDREFQELIDKSKVSDLIIRKPFMSQKALVDIYNLIDVFCLPTYRRSESLSLVGLEAMACGCVVLGSNMAGPATYIRDQVNGFLFEPKQAKDLAKKLQKIQKATGKELDAVRRNARQTAEAYDKEKVKGILIQVFGEAE